MRLSLLLALVLPWLSLTSLSSPCPSLETSLALSDLVAEVSLVSRSRAHHGHYLATFRTDNILQVRQPGQSSSLEVRDSQHVADAPLGVIIAGERKSKRASFLHDKSILVSILFLLNDM